MPDVMPNIPPRPVSAISP